MAIIPPKGINLLPGITIASTIIIGAKTLAAAQISARPAMNGQSRPTLNVRPLNFEVAKFEIPCDNGSTEAMNQ